jgi:hypothetical protein
MQEMTGLMAHAALGSSELLSRLPTQVLRADNSIVLWELHSIGRWPLNRLE